MSQTEVTFSNKSIRWYDRLANLSYEASIPGLVNHLRVEAPMVFRGMVNDIDNPIAPELETEIARYLRSPCQDELKPAVTLMPRMMEKYGICSQQFAALEKQQKAQLVRRCNQCPSASKCWLAMRADAELEECETFCPNQAVFYAISQ